MHIIWMDFKGRDIFSQNHYNTHVKHKSNKDVKRSRVRVKQKGVCRCRFLSKVYRRVIEGREVLNSCRHPERASWQQQYQAVPCRNEQSPEII